MRPSKRPTATRTFRGYLPHDAVPGTRQFVTFSLADAMPRDVAARRVREERSRSEADGRRDALVEAERALDAGSGSCILRDPRAARVVADALAHFDGERYSLLAWVVMPNHVHAAIALRPSWTVARVVQTWKSYTAHEINRRLGRVGRLWKPDFFDLRIRDDEHLSRVRRYIERNPVVAGLCRSPADWPLGSAARLRSDGDSGR